MEFSNNGIITRRTRKILKFDGNIFHPMKYKRIICWYFCMNFSLVPRTTHDINVERR